jgi:hypothetical protein
MMYSKVCSAKDDCRHVTVPGPESQDANQEH